MRASSKTRSSSASSISIAFTSCPLRKPAAREISRFQPVRRDFSLILDQSVAWEKIDQALAALQIPELVDWRVREVFRDAKSGSARVFVAAGHHLPGPRSHPARRGIAGLPIPGRRSGQQDRARAFAPERSVNLDGVYLLWNCRYTSSDTAHLRGGYDSCRNHSLNPRSRNRPRPSYPL